MEKSDSEYVTYSIAFKKCVLTDLKSIGTVFGKKFYPIKFPIGYYENFQVFNNDKQIVYEFAVIDVGDLDIQIRTYFNENGRDLKASSHPCHPQLAKYEYYLYYWNCFDNEKCKLCIVCQPDAEVTRVETNMVVLIKTIHKMVDGKIQKTEEIVKYNN